LEAMQTHTGPLHRTSIRRRFQGIPLRTVIQSILKPTGQPFRVEAKNSLISIELRNETPISQLFELKEKAKLSIVQVNGVWVIRDWSASKIRS
jgi:type II secretory pathway component GspD/PulD (secretin)